MHNKRIKALAEQRDAIIDQMEALTASAVNENGEERAMNEEEQARFAEMEAQVKALNESIKAEQRARDLELVPVSDEKKAEIRAEEAEEKAFADFIRGNASEIRAGELATNANVLPKTIADRVVARVREICPIYELADVYNVKGTLTIPYYPANAATDITAAYASEFTELTSTSGAFQNIDLQAFLGGALTKVSKSLINNASFDVVGFVVERMAEAIAAWLEGECLNGTTNKIAGLSGATQTVEATAAAAVTGDELITLQDRVPDAYQANAVWIMSPATRDAIRKLKDGQQNYLLERDFTAKWGYKLLGKDVYVSDNMPAMATGNRAIIYGDMSGLALKFSEEITIEVLRERFATEHAVGVVGWVECDAKVQDQQKVAVLVMA